jgi:hypothetical protein
MGDTRYDAIGLSGRKGTDNNSQDTRLKTYEIPLTVVASASAQDTGIPLPSGVAQAVSAYVRIVTAEATGVTKTIDVGVVGGSDTAFINAASVAATGYAGAPVTTAVSGGSANLSYTLGSADFVELDAVAVITLAVST